MLNDAPLRVLVVDSESLLCWALRETLTAAGMEVSHAQSPSAALDTVAKDRAGFDVVLLDYPLPDPRASDFIRTLKQLAPALPVVVMSAFWTPERVDQALRQGVERLVSKPLEMHDVAELVRAVVARYGTQIA
jgi:DNA-binding NtrC family response regulator